MPSALADELYRSGRLTVQQPAATFARKVLEHLLVDLSWSSSRLEGNRYSLFGYFDNCLSAVRMARTATLSCC